MKLIHLFALLTSFVVIPSYATGDYTVLNPAEYKKVFSQSRHKVQALLNALKPHRTEPRNEQVAFIANQLAGLPYFYSGGIGEGDWQPNSRTYKPGAVHIDQNPVYRLDGLDCQTFVQVAMALLYSSSLDEFDQHYLQIAYGAAGHPNGEIVHYYNRNNFVDADLNPINQQNGFFTDVTTHGPLSNYAAETSATITRQHWFRSQKKFIKENVNVLDDKNGPAMVARFEKFYAQLPFKKFDAEVVPISYLPKEAIAKRDWTGKFIPNQDVIDKIPTPAVAEIISDPQKWSTNGKLIKDIIGTELNVSHFGLLYRQTFQRGDIIYQKITCELDDAGRRSCNVRPITCERDRCTELMYTHATDVYPDMFAWYQQPDGHFTCSAQKPPHHVRHTTCNRVEQIPLFSYLTDYQYGTYFNMNNPSILGVHIEKLN